MLSSYFIMLNIGSINSNCSFKILKRFNYVFSEYITVNSLETLKESFISNGSLVRSFFIILIDYLSLHHKSSLKLLIIYFLLATSLIVMLSTCKLFPFKYPNLPFDSVLISPAFWELERIQLFLIWVLKAQIAFKIPKY